jgi:hypothetical protein
MLELLLCCNHIRVSNHWPNHEQLPSDILTPMADSTLPLLKDLLHNIANHYDLRAKT